MQSHSQPDPAAQLIKQRIELDYQQLLTDSHHDETRTSTVPSASLTPDIQSKILYFMTIGAPRSLIVQLTSRELLFTIQSHINHDVNSGNSDDTDKSDSLFQLLNEKVEREIEKLAQEKHETYVQWHMKHQLLSFYEKQAHSSSLSITSTPSSSTTSATTTTPDLVSVVESTPVDSVPVVEKQVKKEKSLEVPEKATKKFNLKELDGSFENMVGKELYFSRQNMGYKALCVGKCNDNVLNQFVLHLDEEARLKQLCDTTDFNRLPRYVKGTVEKVVELPAAYRFKFKKSTSMVGCYVQFEYC